MAVRHSAVVAAWNAGKALERLLDSLSSQEVEGGLEVVVVDDLSTDSTPELLRRRSETVRSVRNEVRSGYAASINRGARSARGDVLYLLNSDVELLHPEALQRLADALERPGIGMAVPRYQGPDGRLQPGCSNFRSVSGTLLMMLGLHRLLPDAVRARVAPTKWSHAHSRDVDFAMGAVIAIRADLLAELGGLWPHMFGSEEDLAIRLRRVGGLRVRYVAESLALHIGNHSNRQRWSDPERAERIARSELLVLETHYPRPRAAAIRVISWAGSAARAVLLRLGGRRERAEEYAAMARVYRRGLPASRSGGN